MLCVLNNISNKVCLTGTKRVLDSLIYGQYYKKVKVEYDEGHYVKYCPSMHDNVFSMSLYVCILLHKKVQYIIL